MTERPVKNHHVELSLNDKLKIIKGFKSVPKPTLTSLSENFLKFILFKMLIKAFFPLLVLFLNTLSLSLFTGERNPWKLDTSKNQTFNLVTLRVSSFEGFHCITL